MLPAHHLDLVWGGADFFSGSTLLLHGGGFKAGLQSRRRLQGPRGAPHARRTPAWSLGRRSPGGGGPCTPGGSSGGECSPSSRLAPSPSQGRDRGRWAPRPPGPKGCGAAACGVDGNGSGEVAAGERAALSGPGARRLSGLRSPPLPPPRLPLEPLPRSPEGRVRPGGRKGARPPPASLVPGLGN